MRLPAGTRFGPYAVEEALAEGAHGTVHTARDGVRGGRIALKVLALDLALDGAERERLLAEAPAVVDLTPHPGIVQLIGAGDAEGFLYRAMRLTLGSSLATELAAGPIEPGRVCALLADVAAGLDHAHRRGVTHRDLKAQNILIDRAGRALITDFRVAPVRRLAAADGHARWRGPLDHLAPEVLAGAEPGPRADIYALAWIARRALDETRAAAAARPVLERGLAAAPAGRPASAGALVAELMTALGMSPAER